MLTMQCFMCSGNEDMISHFVMWYSAKKKMGGSFRITSMHFTDDLMDRMSDAYKKLYKKVTSVVSSHSIYSRDVVFSLV